MNKTLNQMDYPRKQCRQTLITHHAGNPADTLSSYAFCNNMEALKQYHRKFKSQLNKTNSKTPKVIAVLFVSAFKALNIVL